MRVVGWVLGSLLLAPAGLGAQTAATGAATADDAFGFHISGELKGNFRWSEDDRFVLAFPFPPDFVPVGQENVAMQTVSPGSSLEVSRALVNLDVEMPREISAHVQIGFINLYDRNPTSKDHTVDVREAWVAFGKKRGSLEPLSGSSLYLLVRQGAQARAPALPAPGELRARLDRVQPLQRPAAAARRLARNPRLLRGTALERQSDLHARPERARRRQRHRHAAQPRPDAPLGLPDPLRRRGRGARGRRALRVRRRFGPALPERGPGRGIDAHGLLLPHATLRGREAARHLLRGRPRHPRRRRRPLAADHGDQREEYGANLDARLGGFSLWAQLVRQQAAGLPRTGFEVEAGYRIRLGDLADAGDLFPTIQPAIRWSRLDDGFSAPKDFVAPSFAWDWSKLDVGLRITIIKKLDLTLEYSFHDIAASRPIQHDEALATLRVVF